MGQWLLSAPVFGRAAAWQPYALGTATDGMFPSEQYRILKNKHPDLVVGKVF
jgi:hypothetical protein